MAPDNWIYMRKEIRIMLYGDPYTLPQGHWVILRRFNKGEYSKYWNESAQEAVGGPKWKYTDYALRASYRIGTGFSSTLTGSLADRTKGSDIPGTWEMDSRVYIIEHCYRPQIEDLILEYDCEPPDDTDGFIEYARTHSSVKFRVKNPESVKSDGGKILYYLIGTVLDQERE